jgi:hypothetical protein
LPSTQNEWTEIEAIRYILNKDALRLGGFCEKTLSNVLTKKFWSKIVTQLTPENILESLKDDKLASMQAKSLISYAIEWKHYIPDAEFIARWPSIANGSK